MQNKNDPFPEIELRPRPSRLNQIFHHCLGALRAEHGLMEIQTKSGLELTDAGDDRHKAIQAWLMQDPDAQEAYLALPMEDRSAVRQWQAQLTELFAKYGRPDSIHIEFGAGRFADLPFQEDTGDADTVLVWSKLRMAIVVDYKGRSDQPNIGEHYQLLSYAVGVQRRWTNLEKVGVMLLQPDLDPQFLILTVAQVRHWRDEIFRLILEAQGKQAPRTPSPHGCRFCLAYMTDRCPETVNQIVKFQAGKTLAPIDLKMGEFLVANWKALEEAVKRFKNHVRMNPAAFPGLTVRKGYTADYVNDTEGTAKLLHEHYNLDFRELIEATKGFSMEKLVTIVQQKTGGDLEQIEKDLKKILIDYGYLGSRDISGAVMAKPTKQLKG